SSKLSYCSSRAPSFDLLNLRGRLREDRFQTLLMSALLGFICGATTTQFNTRAQGFAEFLPDIASRAFADIQRIGQFARDLLARAIDIVRVKCDLDNDFVGHLPFSWTALIMVAASIHPKFWRVAL